MDGLNSAYVWMQKADQANDLRRYDTAKQFAEKAISADPEFADAYAVLGRAFLGLEQFAGAHHAFETALVLEPENAWYLRCLGICSRLMGQMKRGLALLDQSIQICPTDPMAHCERGKCLAAMNQYVPAKQAYEKSIELDPHSSSPFSSLGRLYMDNGKYPDGERSFREALRLEPEDSVALNNLGVCLERQNRLIDAALAFKAALLLDPELDVARTNTKLSVDRHLLEGTFGISAAIFSFFFGLVVLIQGLANGKGDEDFAIFLFFICMGISGVILLHFYATRRRNRNRIASADPQLLEIYRQISRHGKK